MFGKRISQRCSGDGFANDKRTGRANIHNIKMAQCLSQLARLEGLMAANVSGAKENYEGHRLSPDYFRNSSCTISFANWPGLTHSLFVINTMPRFSLGERIIIVRVFS